MDVKRGTGAVMSGPVDAVGVDSRSCRSARLGERREREILTAAYELLAEVGYEGLRLDAVATRARASKATLYRHWPTKAQLVADAVQVCRAGMHDAPDTGSLRGDLVALLNRMAEAISGGDGPLLAGLIMAMRLDPEFARQMRAMYQSKRAICEAIVARAIARGELKPDCDLGVIEEIGSAQMFIRSIVWGEPLDGPYIDHLVDDILVPLLTR